MRTPKTAPPKDARLDRYNTRNRKIEKTTTTTTRTTRATARTTRERRTKSSNTNSNGNSRSEESLLASARTPLSKVVLDCRQRWFLDAARAAECGDVEMQVLLAQMYFHGYGYTKDLQKANFWMTKASGVRPSLCDVSNKRPGYNATDSDSESEDSP